MLQSTIGIRRFARLSAACANHKLSSSRTSRRLFASQQPPPPRDPKKIQFQLTAGAAVVVIVGGAVAARTIYGQFVQTNTNNNNHGFRRDGSTAKVLLQTPAAPAPQQGRIQQSAVLQEMDAAEFQDFCQQQRHYLKESALRNQQQAKELLHQELRNILPVDRIGVFRDWYFSYPTTYQLLGVAMKSALQHAVSIRNEQTLAEKVSHDLQTVVQQKYQAMVLRPALLDPKIHRVFVKSLHQAQASYWNTVSNMEASVAHFVMQQSKPYVQPLQHHQVVVNLDWTAQLQKVQHLPAVYDKKTPTTSVALIAGGAAVGKMAGGAAMGGAAKALTAKLAAPFATKAAGAALSSKAAAGAATGALVGGPLLGGVAGAVAGAALGVGVDMTVNLGVAVMQRSAFEQDVRDCLEETLQEWEDTLGQELANVQSVWYGHAEDVVFVGLKTTSTTSTTPHPGDDDSPKTNPDHLNDDNPETNPNHPNDDSVVETNTD